MALGKFIKQGTNQQKPLKGNLLANKGKITGTTSLAKRDITGTPLAKKLKEKMKKGTITKLTKV